jgi:hypothetical protein
MVKCIAVFLLCISGFAFAQLPLPGEGKYPEALSPEQKALNFLKDSLWSPELFKGACKGDRFKKGKQFLVYDSTFHLPEPIMVYKFANPSLSHEELVALTERQIIQFGERSKFDFNVFESPGVHFTPNSKAFKPDYYFIRISQPMLYEDYLYFDLWIKETSVLPGINVLIRTDLRGNVDAWQSYAVCHLREK